MPSDRLTILIFVDGNIPELIYIILPVTSTAGLRILEDSQDEEVNDENNN